MQKPELSKMTGMDIWKYYENIANDRDYANTIFMAMESLGDKALSMLEQAEKDGKRLKIVHDESLWSAGAYDCPYSVIVE